MVAARTISPPSIRTIRRGRRSASTCRSATTDKVWMGGARVMGPTASAKRDVLALVEDTGRITYVPDLPRPVEAFTPDADSCWCHKKESRRRRA